MRGKVGSERKFASSDKFAKSRCRRDRGFYLGIPPAGTPKYWFLDRGIWAKKNPITRPIDCYLDCERRRYFEKVANTLAFWRQKSRKAVNSYAFSYFLRQYWYCPRGIGSWRGSRTAPRASPRPSRVKVTSGVTAPSKINENRWKIEENRWKLMKNDEKQWKLWENNENRWKSMKINDNWCKSMKNRWKSLKTKENRW